MSTPPLQKLFFDQLSDIYYAEKELVKALPKMEEAADHEHLKNAIRAHLKETETHVTRIESVFESLERKPRAKKCEAIIGILKEAAEIAEEYSGTAGIDAAVICACQKVEHYEIATYGCLVTWAELLGFAEATKLLSATLDEEEQADSDLTEIAETACNREAEAG